MRYTTVLFLLISCFSFGQRGIIHYSKENGLASNEVNALTYDKQGFLWLATNNGIDRFDGQRFNHFKHSSADKKSILGNKINAIVFDGKESIYASVENKGLVILNTKSLAIKNYTKTSGSPVISGNKILSFCKDNSNTIWAAQQGWGLDKIEEKKVTNYAPSRQFPGLNVFKANTFFSVFQDKFSKQYLWCLSDIGLFQFNKNTGKWSHFPVDKNHIADGAIFTSEENKLRSITQDGKGNLYIGTANGTFLYFDQIQKEYKVFRDEKIVELKAAITGLAYRDTRYIYTCLENKEFLLFDTKTKDFIRFDDDEKIDIRPFGLARHGSEVAICSKQLGLFVQNENQIYGSRNAFPSSKTICSNQSQTSFILESTDGKIELRSLSEPAQTGRTIPGIYGIQSVIQYGSQDFVISARNGYFILHRDGTLKKLPELLTQEGKSLITASDGVIYLYHEEDGLFKFNAKANQWLIFKHPGPQFRKAWSVRGKINTFSVVDSKAYLSGSEGIYEFDLKTLEFKALSKLNNRISDEITTSAYYNNILWFGTSSSGLFGFDPKTQRIVREYDENKDFPLQTIQSITKDRFGNLWVLSSSFVIKINSKKNQFELLGESNGLSKVRSILCSGNSIYFIQENAIVSGSLVGSIPMIYDPKPYIQRVLVLNNDNSPLNLKTFSSDQNSIQFEFGVLDFGIIGDNKVQYRLKGLDDTWRPGNNRDEVSYYNLPGGDYRFELKVTVGNREFISGYSITVYNPYYKTWWFILFVTIFTISGIWLYIRLRIKRIKTTERMKAQFSADLNEMESKALQAQMNPHFLFNSLNSIRLFILKNDVDSAANYIAKFSKLLRMILNYSRHDMITVYDEIQAMKLYLDFEKLRFDNGFDFDIEIDGQNVLDVQLPPLIVQPFIENAIWHGLMARLDSKGELHISFKIEEKVLHVTVEDNGVGREKAKENNSKRSLKEGSVGLQITKERLKGLSFRTGKKNEFEIVDLYDENNQPKGTLVNLYFEL